MSIRGSLETMPCRDLLEWVSKNRRSGSLQLHRGAIAKDIYFQDGKIISSGSNDPQEFLGQFFISFGKLSEEDLVKAYQVQRETKVYLGKILVMIGKASEAQVQKVLVHKTRETMLDCFLWDSGNFTFVSNQEPLPGQSISVALEIAPIITEGDERAVEWRDIRKAIPDLDAEIRITRENFPAGFPEKPDDQKLIRILESGKRIPDICYEFHMSPFLVGKKIHHLAQRGIVAIGKMPAKKPVKTADLEDLVKLGKTQFDQGKMIEAQETFSKVLAKKPDHEEATHYHAQAREVLLKKLTSEMDETLIPKLVVEMSQLSATKLDAQEGYVVSRINGSWSVGEIVQICPFPREKVLNVIARFAKEKLIEWQRR